MKKIFKNAIFEYDKEDEDLILDLNNYIDEHVDEIYYFFGNDVEREIPYIRIIRTKEEFDKLCRKYYEIYDNQPIPNWLIGFTNNDGIFYLSINDYKSTSHAFKKEDYEENLDYYKKTIVHEYIHFVNILFCKKHNCYYTIKYLSEGVAQVLSKQNEKEKLKFVCSLDDLLNGTNCYNGWYLVFKYIINNYPQEFILELFKDDIKAQELITNIYDDIKKYYKEKSR